MTDCMNDIEYLKNEGFDVSHYMPQGGWTNEQLAQMTEEQYMHFTHFWYKKDVYYKMYYICLDILTNNSINDLTIDIDYKYSMSLCNENPTLDIDRLLDMLNGMTDLTIYATTGNIKITRPPQTLINLTTSNPLLEITNLPDTLELYKHTDNMYEYPITIPQLPNKNIAIDLIGKCLTETFYNLSSLITDIKIEVDYLGLNIDVWPLNLKTLSIKINRNTETDKNETFGILPYGLETFDLHAQNYMHPFDIPPTLKKFSFICRVKYPYPECLDGLPDNIKIMQVNYTCWPEIGKLPKNCKTLIYPGCPNDVFDYITKNRLFQGVQISKKTKFVFKIENFIAYFFIAYF